FFFYLLRPPPSSPLFPYTTLFRSRQKDRTGAGAEIGNAQPPRAVVPQQRQCEFDDGLGFGPRHQHGRGDDQRQSPEFALAEDAGDRKSTRLNSSHLGISYAVFCLK